MAECKYCGTLGLRWLETSKGWRLAEEGQVWHRCPPKGRPAVKRKEPGLIDDPSVQQFFDRVDRQAAREAWYRKQKEPPPKPDLDEATVREGLRLAGENPWT